MAKLSGQQTPGSSCLYLPGAGITGRHYHVLFFFFFRFFCLFVFLNMSSEAPTPRLWQGQALYTLNHLPGPVPTV